MRLGHLAAAALAVTAAAPAAAAPTGAAADSFTPVRMAISVSLIARRGGPLPITVTVNADAGVLDGTDGPVRIAVKLAAECGGSFETTRGDTLIDQALSPQPATGVAYTATARASGRPSALGAQTVCAYVEDTGVNRVYANDESLTVDVTAACTAKAASYDAAQRALAAAEQRLRHTHKPTARRRLQRTIASDLRSSAHDRVRARASCGAALPL